MLKRSRVPQPMFAIISAVVLLFVAVGLAQQINADADAAENIAVSAPQQSAAEAQAARRALTDGLGMFGSFGALLFINLAAFQSSKRDDDDARTLDNRAWDLGTEPDDESEPERKPRGEGQPMTPAANPDVCPHCKEPWQPQADGRCSECGKPPH